MNDFILQLSKIRQSSTFLSIKGYKNEFNEVADYNLIFNVSYKNTLEKSLAMLELIETTNELEATAKQELIESINKSLSSMKEVPLEEVNDAYSHIQKESGDYVKGVKIHKETNAIHLYGLVVAKKVIAEGIYKHKNQRPLTIVKDAMRRKLPINSFRQFKITSDKVESISVEKLTLLPPEVL